MSGRATGATAVALGLAALGLTKTVLPGWLPAVSVALAAGLLAGTARPADGEAASALVRTLLPFAIVLVGLGVTFDEIGGLGWDVLALVAAALVVGLGVGLLAARALGVPRRLAALLALGTAVCGNTAILAAAPVLRARREEVAYAVAATTLFGTVAVLCFPPLGHLLGLSDDAFGLWAGLGVNDTAQVIATGFAFSEEAGETATTVKLVRNASLGPILFALALAMHRGRAAGRPSALGGVPWFVWGFAAAAALASAGVVPDGVADAASWFARALILVVMAAVGLSIRVDALRGTGPRPLVAALVAMSSLSALVLAAVLSGVGG